MSAYGGDDVQEKLYDLEQEERRIMQELMDIDDADHAARDLSHNSDHDRNPRHTLNSLLAECEKEVRNAKGFIKSSGPPIQIARCKVNAGPIPKHATFLSRPKDTGVDFTIPVTLPEYLAVIKSPIFLNGIRDKCKNGLYTSSEDYLDDMRLLARNTAMFNRGEDLAWVVQHARLLLEAAEDAVSARRVEFYAAEGALRQAHAAAAAAAASAAQPGSSGKRKRSHEQTNGVSHTIPPVSSIPPPTEPVSGASVPVGARLSVLWHEDQLWYTARVVKKPSAHRAEVVYDEDKSRQLLDLRSHDWRPVDLSPRTAKSPVPQAPSSTPKTRKSTGSEQPATKRSKGSANSSASGPTAKAEAVLSGTQTQVSALTKTEMEEYTEFWSARLEQVKLSLLEEVHTRFDRIEQSILRSDPMRRVLLAVSDLSDTFDVSTRRIENRVNSFETRLEQVAALANSRPSLADEKELQSDGGPCRDGGHEGEQIGGLDISRNNQSVKDSDNPEKPHKNRLDQTSSPKNTLSKLPSADNEPSDAASRDTEKCIGVRGSPEAAKPEEMDANNSLIRGSLNGSDEPRVDHSSSQDKDMPLIVSRQDAESPDLLRNEDPVVANAVQGSTDDGPQREKSEAEGLDEDSREKSNSEEQHTAAESKRMRSKESSLEGNTPTSPLRSRENAEDVVQDSSRSDLDNDVGQENQDNSSDVSGPSSEGAPKSSKMHVVNGAEVDDDEADLEKNDGSTSDVSEEAKESGMDVDSPRNADDSPNDKASKLPSEKPADDEIDEDAESGDS